MIGNLQDIGKLLLQRRKEIGLTQQELGERVGVSKSEISKIENGRGVTMPTVSRLAEALGVLPRINLQPTVNVTRGMIHYVVMNLGRFAAKYGLTRQEACNYLSDNKGLSFVIDNYEVEHQLSLSESVDDMAAICRRNGGQI